MINKNEYEMINHIFHLTEIELLQELPKILSQNKYSKKNIVTTPNYIYAKGNIPVILVAHLDTVHEFLPENIYYDRDMDSLWSENGLGADDRAGVCAIIALLKYKPYILFTTQEEIGCQGASIAAKEISLPEKIKFIIELDRMGENDCVFYSCDNPDFEQYINDFGYITEQGSYSDISALCPHWGVAGVNLSIGYYNAHTKQEYLNVNNYINCISMVENILSNLPEDRFEYIPKIYPVINRGMNSRSYKDFLNSYYSNYFDYDCQKDDCVSISPLYDFECCKCGDISNLTVHDDKYFCDTCFDENYFYCENCGTYKSIKHQSLFDKELCDRCYKQIINI